MSNALSAESLQADLRALREEIRRVLLPSLLVIGRAAEVVLSKGRKPPLDLMSDLEQTLDYLATLIPAE